MNEQEVVALMESSKTAAEWNANHDKVVAQYNGFYPLFWFGAIVQSGVMGRTVAAFGRDA